MVDTDLAHARQNSNTHGSNITVDATEPFASGERVQTPRGAGVVVYQRMKPPNFTVAEAYSVRLDGLDHVGAVFAAGDVAAEGAQP